MNEEAIQKSQIDENTKENHKKSDFSRNLEIFKKNFYFLLISIGMKIVQFEEALGLKQGYFARTFDRGKFPPTEVMMDIAKCFNRSIEDLLTCDFTMGGNEKIFDFIKKLNDTTVNGELKWEEYKQEEKKPTPSLVSPILINTVQIGGERYDVLLERNPLVANRKRGRVSILVLSYRNTRTSVVGFWCYEISIFSNEEELLLFHSQPGSNDIITRELAKLYNSACNSVILSKEALKAMEDFWLE